VLGRPALGLAPAPAVAGGRPANQVPKALRPSTGASKGSRRGPAAVAATGDVEGDPSLVALTREWLLELKVMGRSPLTIKWYTQKLDWYRRTGQAQRLSELTAFELKRYLGELRDRGLADQTIHAFFEVLKAFANWASREGYAVDPALLRVRAPRSPKRRSRPIPPSSRRRFCRQRRQAGRRFQSRSCWGLGCGCQSSAD
jgi:Phage integrase, N-terminal SAM-like domain